MWEQDTGDFQGNLFFPLNTNLPFLSPLYLTLDYSPVNANLGNYLLESLRDGKREKISQPQYKRPFSRRL